MKITRQLLIDACNAVHAVPALRAPLAEGLDVAVAHLMVRAQLVHDAGQDRTFIVIDGVGVRPDIQPVDPESGLAIVYTAAGQTADAWIEQHLGAHHEQMVTTVVSADRALCLSAESHGAYTLSPQSFWEWSIEVESLEAQRRARRQLKRPPLSPDAFSALDKLNLPRRPAP